MRLLSALLALALLAPALSGCDTAASGDLDAPGVLAPAAFSFDPGFPSAKTSAGENFNNAAVRVGVVSAIIGANLILPAAATSAATRTQPVVVDGVWIWESTFRLNGDDVTFRLEGTPEGREVEWRLGITNAELDDFTLYTARTDFSGETGDWRLYYNLGGQPTEVLRADFEVVSADRKELTFSIPPGRDAAGTSVRYIHDGQDRAFDWHEEPAGLDHYVEWDAVTHAGSIEADTFNGGVRACWDASLSDAPCSVAAR